MAFPRREELSSTGELESRNLIETFIPTGGNRLKRWKILLSSPRHRVTDVPPAVAATEEAGALDARLTR